MGANDKDVLQPQVRHTGRKCLSATVGNRTPAWWDAYKKPQVRGGAHSGAQG
jgi:hypothetical protein